MDKVFVDNMAVIVPLMPEEKLVQMLPEMSADKLWGLPFEMLIEKLPSVPVMHLDFWIPPKKDPDLPDTVATETTPTQVVYTLPQTREQAWSLLVSSPAPFEKVWARFNRSLSDVKVVTETLQSKPPGTPDLLPGRIANSFFRVDIENADPADIAVAAVIAFVDKSWLNANQVHKWSIEFNRFDKQQNAWVPSPTKRVRETSERLFFAVMLPGFSDLAITGGTGLHDQIFQVSDLQVFPDPPVAGRDIVVSATVTNTGEQRAVYPANLWIDHTIEATQMVVAEPGQPTRYSFTIRKPEGRYRLRVERLLRSVTVGTAGPAVPPGPASVAVPATGDLTPWGSLLLSLAAVSISLVLYGALLVFRRRNPSTQGG